MRWWKQGLLCLLILAVAMVVWYNFFPGAARTVAQWTSGSAPVSDGPGRAGGGPRQSGFDASPVVTVPVTSAVINDRVVALGTGSALHSVVLRPLSAGRLQEILVEPGSQVETGDVIARLESETQAIALARAELALDDARARNERIAALRASNTVTAVQLTEAELALRNAELALREARLALDRREIVAPLSGTIGLLEVSPGAYVTSSDDIVTIDDRSQILVDFWVPERYARTLGVGTPLTARSVARPDEVYSGLVRAIDNQVDPKSRTLRIQGRISNPVETLRSGMAFRVSMDFEGESFPAVDPLAIQWSTDGAFVWVVREGIAQRTPVQVLQRNTDSVLVDGAFLDGDHVVVEGIHSVREGQGVPMAGEDGAGRTRGS